MGFFTLQHYGCYSATNIRAAPSMSMCAGTFNVMEACVAKGVKRLVSSSSASVYGDAVREPMDEDHPFNNKNFYGATKIAGEAMLRAFHHRYGLNYVGLRYMNVYGPRQDYHGAYIAVIMKMLDAIDNGQSPTIMGDGSEAFDFVAVEDCGLANVCAMKATPPMPTTTWAPASVLLSKNSPNSCLKSPAATSQSITRRAARPRWSATASVARRRPAPKSVSTQHLILREGLKRLIEWRASHKAEVAARRQAVGLPA
jgi:UDP-glucose 4-epimerase